MSVKVAQEEFKEILEIGDSSDFSVDIRASKPKKIPTKTVSLYLEDMEIKDTINQPFLFIILPFFTSKRQRNVNLVYEIANAGIKFGSSLSTDDFDGIKNQQPSDFEKNVFYFIMYKFQELLMGASQDSSLEGHHIIFNIEEVLEYLNLKFSMKYYRKMEETLYNLQATTYKVVIRNRKKAGNIIREVYKEPLNLIKYEKVKERNEKTNKMKVYYKVRLDDRIIDELKRKHYSIFDRHLLTDIRNADKAAEKIYQYISMKRFADSLGEQRLETLATIIPLATVSRITKKLKNGKYKEYQVSKLKQVLKRVKKCFDVLVDKGYLEKYEVEELKEQKSYKFIYHFNPEGDNSCHISSYVKPALTNNKSGKVIHQNENGFSETLNEEIIKAKKNIFVTKAWNKRVDNKLKNLLKNEGEEYTINILRLLYDNLTQDIDKTLVSYINGIVKNLKNKNIQLFRDDNLLNLDSFKLAKENNINTNDLTQKELVEGSQRMKYDKVEDDIEEAKIVEEASSDRKRKVDSKVSSRSEGKTKEEQPVSSDPIDNLVWELYIKSTEAEQTEIRDLARKLYLEETDSKDFNLIHETIFKGIERGYIVKVLRAEKGL